MIKHRNSIKAISLIIAVSVFIASCSSTTMIQSTPNGAKLYIDGESVGTTPYAYTDAKVMGSITTIKLEKEGYQPLVTSISRNEEADFGAIVGGCFLLFPFLWTMKYKASHNYELISVNGNQEHYLKAEPVSLPPKQIQPQPIQKDTRSKADRLRELKQLLDEKLINQQDYDKEKSKILESEY